MAIILAPIDPNEQETSKEDRIRYYYKLLSEGKKFDELLTLKRFNHCNDQQLLWDTEDAYDRYKKDNRMELMCKGSKEEKVEAHVMERKEIATSAKNNGELGIALDAVKDMAKIQGLYDEVQKIDTKVEFVFKFDDMKTKPVIDVTPEVKQIGNDSQ